MLIALKNIFSRKIFQFVFIIFVTLGVYSNTFDNQFVMDDYDFITDWPLIQDLNNIPQFFFGYETLPHQPGIYSPLKTLFHALNYYFFGDNPLGYHIVALLIHFAGIACAYILAQLLTKNNRISFISTLLFAIHPVHVEAITGLTASIDTLGVVFLMGSLIFYIKARQLNLKERLHYILALVFGLLAVFTHELTVALPLILIWYDFCFHRDKDDIKKSVLRVLPFFIIVFGYVVLKAINLGTFTRGGGYVFDSFYLTMLISVKALFKYVLICFLPITLTHNQVIASGIYSFDVTDFDAFAVLSQSPFDLLTLAGILCLGGLLYIIVRQLKNNPLVSFCIGFFLISLLPGLNIIPSGVFFAERYMYHGLLGFTLLMALVFDFFLKKDQAKILALVILIVSCLLFSIRSFIRNNDWQNEITFFKSAVTNNPNSALMHIELGIILTKNQKYEEALQSFERALAINEDNPETYFALSDVYIEMRNNSKAIAMLEKALELNPEFADAYYNLAGLYAFWGMNKEARVNLDKAMYYFTKEGRTEEAQQYLGAFLGYFGTDESGDDGQ